MSTGMERAREAINELLRAHGLFRPRDLEALGISRAWLRLFAGLGFIDELAPAVFGDPSRRYPAAAIAAIRLPRAVVCLRSALELHGVLPASDRPLCLAIPRTARTPLRLGLNAILLREGPATFGRELQPLRLGRIPIAVYGPQRSLVDCLKHARKSGLAYLPSRLRTGWLHALATPDDQDRERIHAQILDALRQEPSARMSQLEPAPRLP